MVRFHGDASVGPWSSVGVGVDGAGGDERGVGPPVSPSRGQPRGHGSRPARHRSGDGDARVTSSTVSFVHVCVVLSQMLRFRLSRCRMTRHLLEAAGVMFFSLFHTPKPGPSPTRRQREKRGSCSRSGIMFPIWDRAPRRERAKRGSCSQSGTEPDTSTVSFLKLAFWPSEGAGSLRCRTGA
jgi:hypothetical protein